jgi:hypothetical protein
MQRVDFFAVSFHDLEPGNILIFSSSTFDKAASESGFGRPLFQIPIQRVKRSLSYPFNSDKPPSKMQSPASHICNKRLGGYVIGIWTLLADGSSQMTQVKQADDQRGDVGSY